MARTNGAKTEKPPEIEDTLPEESSVEETKVTEETEATENLPELEPEPATETQGIDDCLNALKTLLSTVEKLQKVRQEVGDIKPLLVRMLDGEVIAGEELEQLKTGVNGLSRLVKAYSDHQSALTNAQPARGLLDTVLKPRTGNS